MKSLQILSIFLYTILVFVFGLIFNDLMKDSIVVDFIFGVLIGIFLTIMIVIFVSILSEWIDNNDFKWLDVLLKFSDEYKYKTYRRRK